MSTFRPHYAMTVRIGVIALLVLLAAAGCGGSDETSAAASPTGSSPVDTAQATESTVPEDPVRAVIDGLRAFPGSADTATLDERMSELAVPGVSIAVIDDGELAWARGFGTTDIEVGEDVDETTIFQTGSISKPLAAYATLLLAQDERLDLDEPISTYVTSWAIPDNEYTRATAPTFRSTLSHTAGFTQSGFLGYPEGVERPEGVGVLEGMGNSPAIDVDFEPTTTYRYAGGGYIVAQQAVSDITGQSFEQVMAERVLSPLGMDDSTYEQPLPADRRDQAALGHIGSAPIGGFFVYPEQAAAGLWSTPTDLSRFVLAVQASLAGGDALLSPELTRELITPPAGTSTNGLGLYLNGRWFSHLGSNVGYEGILVGSIDGGDGAVVLTNSSGDGATLAREILNAVAETYNWSEWNGLP